MSTRCRGNGDHRQPNDASGSRRNDRVLQTRPAARTSFLEKPSCRPRLLQRLVSPAFGQGRVECRVDCPVPWATGNRESCFWFGVDEREARPAIPLLGVSLHECTDPELVHRCIPFAGPKRVVLPRLDTPLKTGAPRGTIRMRSNNRFPLLCLARRVRGGTTLGIPGRHPKQARPRLRPSRSTCRREPG
jgi:hypothetical protein